MTDLLDRDLGLPHAINYHMYNGGVNLAGSRETRVWHESTATYACTCKGQRTSINRVSNSALQEVCLDAPLACDG